MPKKKKNWKTPLTHQKIKCLFLNYIELMMIGQAIWVTKVNWNFWIMFNFWWSAEWSKWWMLTEMQEKMKKRPPKSLKNKMFWITFNFWWSAEWSEWQTSTKIQKIKVIKKWNVHFWIMFNFWWPTEQSEWQTSPEAQKTKKK